MIELLALLRANGFTNFIATGGSEDSCANIRAGSTTSRPSACCGTAQAAKFGYAKDGTPILTQEPKLVLNNLEAGKIENFWLLYGRRPHARLRQLLLRRSADARIREGGLRPRLSAAVLHDDAEREYAYGPAQGLPDTRSEPSARRCTTWRSNRAGSSSA